MNNRYLYRAKRCDTGEWVEGSLITGVFFRLGQDIPYILCPDKADYDCFEDFSEENGIFEVDPSAICQCTGLKDKNGVLIWENDIVRIVYNGIEYIYKVIWDASELDFKATNGKENYESNFQYLTCCEEIEIIGNSFDNPELLEQ